jgi:hypothetical protein
MTYEQYKQLFDEATAQIADRVAKIQPRAGNRASVNGMGISIEPFSEEHESEAETWTFALLCKTEQYSTVGEEEPDYDPRPYVWLETAAYQPRGTDYWYPVGFNPGIPLIGQLIDIPPDDTGPVKVDGFKRSCSLEFFSSTTEAANFGAGVTEERMESIKSGFKFPVKVTVEVVAVNYREGGAVESYTVAETHTFFVGFDGDKKFFTAPYQDKQFEFRIVNIVRME